jgi:hypothetical protein
MVQKLIAFLKTHKLLVGFACALVAILLAAAVLYTCRGNACPNGLLGWLEANWKLSYLGYSILVCIVMAVAFAFVYGPGQGAEQAAVTWGSISFALFLFFFLGASQNTREFLEFFLFGCIGAASGYLTGVWLAPSSTSEETRFARAQGMIATIAAGALGTKFLSLVDVLTDGKKDALIFDAKFYFPILSTLAGYLIALSAFYTIRTFGEGVVRITSPKLSSWSDASGKGDNGVPADLKVQFSGAANFPDDMSVSWSLNGQNAAAGGAGRAPSLDTTGELTAPDNTWIQNNPTCLDWAVIAISNRDPSKSAACEIHFFLK